MACRNYSGDPYAHIDTHGQMLRDEVATMAYRTAILNNSYLFKDKVVLDIGCGTGLFSLFAAKAGAKHVVGIDVSNILDQTQKIIEANGFQDTITLVKGKLEEVELPIKQFDIIISQWMGYFLLYESMLDTVIVARDKYLKRDGHMFPDKATMFLAAFADQDYKEERIGFWDDVYGFDYSCLKDVALSEPLVDNVDLKSVVTSVCQIKQFDLLTVTKEELAFDVPFSLECMGNDYIHAFLVWFDISFNCGNKLARFSTGPHVKDTHWKQTIFYTHDTIMVRKDTKVEGSISCAPNAQNNRDLDIRIQYKDPQGQDNSLTYKMF